MTCIGNAWTRLEPLIKIGNFGNLTKLTGTGTNMDKKNVKIVDETFPDLESLMKSVVESGSRKMIGLWILEDYKERFDILQKTTKNEFGKRCQDMIMLAIDKVDPKT